MTKKNLTHNVLAFALGLSVTFCAIAIGAPKEPASIQTASNWEYMVVAKKAMPLNEWATEISNLYGSKGWELVAVQNYDAGGYWVFKHAKK